MHFSKTLKYLRKQKHITQEQLAIYLNVSRSAVAGYETKNHQPDFENLQKLARFFGVSIDYLISGKDFITLQTEEPIHIDEPTLDHEVMIAYQQLSPVSKQNVLRYLRLLQSREE